MVWSRPRLPTRCRCLAAQTPISATRPSPLALSSSRRPSNLQPARLDAPPDKLCGGAYRATTKFAISHHHMKRSVSAANEVANCSRERGRMSTGSVTNARATGLIGCTAELGNCNGRWDDSSRCSPALGDFNSEQFLTSLSECCSAIPWRLRYRTLRNPQSVIYRVFHNYSYKSFSPFLAYLEEIFLTKLYTIRTGK